MRAGQTPPPPGPPPRQLVFIHGRSQQEKRAGPLKAEWVAALREGLGKEGRALSVSDKNIRFPYYGKTLYRLAYGNPAGPVPKVVMRGRAEGGEERSAGKEEQFAAAVIREVQAEVGVSDAVVAEEAGRAVAERGWANKEWIRAALSVLDRRVPHLGAATLPLLTRDVDQYLRNPGVRDPIESGVRQALQPRVPTVVVAHSLGSVVAYNLLTRDGEDAQWDIPLLVTLGSPLAIAAIRRRLRPLRFPPCVGRWFNARDSRDLVALHPLDRDHFDGGREIENTSDIDNPTDNRHGIRGYLADANVAQQIHDALVP